MSRGAPALHVVITGASSGIGAATAEAFARNGAALVLASRDPRGLETVAERCRRMGVQVFTHQVDITDAVAVHRLAQAAQRQFGRVDLWFSNPGVGAIGRLWDVPPETHRRIIETNLIGHLNEAHAAIPIFRAQRRGVFVNMISVGGFAAAPWAAAYSAAKFGLRGLSEALRGELHDMPDIHVCDVYPAFVDTPAARHAAMYTGTALPQSTMMPLLDPRTVARAIVRLAMRPRPTTVIGLPAHLMRAVHAVAPQALARRSGRAAAAMLAKADPGPDTTGNLFASPRDGGDIVGGLNPWRSGTRIWPWLAVGTAAVAATIAVRR